MELPARISGRSINRVRGKRVVYEIFSKPSSSGRARVEAQLANLQGALASVEIPEY